MLNVQSVDDAVLGLAVWLRTAPFGNLDRRAHADFRLLVRKGTFSQAKVSASRSFNLPISC